jgi:hypothetical protein
MMLGFLGKMLSPIGGALGAISQGQAHNRGEKLGGQMDLERLLMERDGQYFDQRMSREAEGRAGMSDAWRKLLMAERVGTPGDRPQLSPYSVKPRQATEAELYGADGMKNEVMKRLINGNPIAPVTERPMEVDRNLLNPGKMERILGYLSPILGAAGHIARPQPQQNFNPQAGLTQVVPGTTQFPQGFRG